MGKSSPPAPPDPHETSAASTGTNVGTAVANANLGNVNQVTPDGSLNYSQSGTYKWTDPYTNQTYDIPQYTATQTLSGAGQGIHDTNVQTQQNLATLGRDQSAALGTLLSSPVDLSSANVDKYSNTHFSDDFDNDWGKQRTALETDLANRGIRMGSDAYSGAISDFSRNRQAGYDNLLGDMYGHSVNSILTERNTPINEVTALLSGGQVAQPNFINPNEPTIPTTDVGGLINANYQDRMGIWQQQQANQQNVLGGLFGLGAAALM